MKLLLNRCICYAIAVHICLSQRRRNQRAGLHESYVGIVYSIATGRSDSCTMLHFLTVAKCIPRLNDFPLMRKVLRLANITFLTFSQHDPDVRSSSSCAYSAAVWESLIVSEIPLKNCQICHLLVCKDCTLNFTSKKICASLTVFFDGQWMAPNERNIIVRLRGDRERFVISCNEPGTFISACWSQVEY